MDVGWIVIFFCLYKADTAFLTASLEWYILERHLAKQAWTENKIGQQLPTGW